MMFEGAQIIRDRVAKYNIGCDLKHGGVYAAIGKGKVHGLREQKALWEKWGHKGLQLIEDKAEIKKVVNTDRYEAILIDPTGGHFHPLNLTLGEAAALEHNGGTIDENSGVTRIDRGTTTVVHTAQGKGKTRNVSVACNAYMSERETKRARRYRPATA